MKLRATKHLLILAAIIAGYSGNVQAATNVIAGTDYLSTGDGTFFNFGPGIGRVDFMGRPINTILGQPYNPIAGPTDTVVQRKTDATFGVAINIEILALELKSVAPVTIGAGTFNVFVSLNPSLSSVGQMTINADGTYISDFTVNFTANFELVTGVGEVGPFSLQKHFTTLVPGHWSSTPEAGSWIVENPPNPSALANTHLNRAFDQTDFYITGQTLHDAGDGQHVVCPEPCGSLLLIASFAGLIGIRRVRTRA